MSQGRVPITQVTEDIARVCHEANRAICNAYDDNVQVSWDEASEEQRKSCEDGVRFHVFNPQADSAASHNNWMKFKLDDGWHHGPTRNEELKTHPCLVPYNELPAEQKVKDHVFKAIVHALNP
ncbi:MAG TPA: RyR domain-containing protein [Dehalococcoidia bacterium]|nr:RyR domain-containing protein [Dehalococcoidia bacterium]